MVFFGGVFPGYLGSNRKDKEMQQNSFLFRLTVFLFLFCGWVYVLMVVYSKRGASLRPVLPDIADVYEDIPTFQ
jgi:hypothetical protein